MGLSFGNAAPIQLGAMQAVCCAKGVVITDLPRHPAHSVHASRGCGGGGRQHLAQLEGGA